MLRVFAQGQPFPEGSFYNRAVHIDPARFSKPSGKVKQTNIRKSTLSAPPLKREEFLVTISATLVEVGCSSEL